MKPTHCEACGAEGKVGALSGLCAVCEDDVALHTAALELVDLELPAARLCPICEREVGSDLGDTFKEMVAGERALKAGGHANTMNQFAAE